LHYYSCAPYSYYKSKHRDASIVDVITASFEGLYEYSQIIINTTSATSENRLRIVDKSSKAAGTYTCKVSNPRGSMNGSVYIQGKEHKTGWLSEI
jgi:hypothetical protein